MSKATAPQGWSYAAIGELCTLINGRAFKPSDWTDTGLPIIRIQNLNNPDAKFNYFLGDVAPKFIVENGELLFAWSGTPGTSFGAHIWNGEKAILNQHIFRVLFNEIVIDKTFFRIAINQKLQELIDKAHGGVGLRHVTKGKFEHTKILLPPLNEQRRIVAKIETLKARSQQAKEALEAIPPLLDQFRQSVLAAAFRGDLTADWREKNPDVEPAFKVLENIRYKRLNQANTSAQLQKLSEIYSDQEEEDSDLLPECWKYIALEKLCESFQYGTSTKSMPLGQVPVLRMGNIQNGEIDWTDLVYTSDEEEIEKYRLKQGDVLFNRTNSPELVGKTSIYRGERPAIFAGYLIKINNFVELDSEYLNYCLNTSYAKDYCWKVKTDGVSQSNINAQKLGKFEIPFCSIEEQQEIVHRIKSLLKVANRIKQEYQEAKAYLDQLDQSILAKAFLGKLVPQDPNDEPASVLLERIRAERAKREVEAKAAKKSTAKTTGQRRRKVKQQDSESVQLGLPGLE